MENAAEGCAGCFIWLAIFIITSVIAVSVGVVFWAAVGIGVIVLVIAGGLSLIVRGIISLFK
jgi:hypothetical protein